MEQKNLIFVLFALIAVVAAQTCVRDVPASSDVVPTSPSFMTVSPAVDYVYNSPNDWRYMDAWTSNIVLTTANGNSRAGSPVSGAINITGLAWGNPNWWFVNRYALPMLRANSSHNYQVSFAFKLGENLSTANTIKNFTVYVLKSLNVNATSNWIPDQPASNVLLTVPVTLPLNSSTTWMVRNATFKPTQHYSGGILAFKVEGNQGPANGNSFFFRDLKFSILSRSVEYPTLLTKDSELVKSRKPSTTLDPRDNTTCPHLRSGLKDWHNPTTWGGVVPSASSTITLPANTSVLVSSCSFGSAVYQKIVIPPTSELIFNDANINLNVRNILVQGKLWIGSEKCRLYSKINITFYGAKTTNNDIVASPPFGSKGIGAVKGSFISIQGKQYHYTWTRLAATAWSGDYVINLQDNVNWEVGQEIVITTSTWKDELDNQNEVKTIAAISGKRVQLTTPLQFAHYGGQEYQAEVGLLTRRINLQGASDSDAESFGGHVIVSSEGQFSGVRFHKMGQRNIKARYPVHFHMADTLTKSYVKDCSITKSYYRCVTVHGTHNSTVSRNVAFDVTGHCYYIEDGVEENNTISYNLASFVHVIGKPASGPGGDQGGDVVVESADLRQPADIAASGFYITNAYNRIVGNAASGGWAGFSFPNLFNGVGMYRNATINPSTRPNLEFDGNSAHSSGYYWVYGSTIYVGGNLYHNDSNGGLQTYKSGRVARQTKYPNGTNAWLHFTNTKVALCNWGVGFWGDRLELVDYEAHDVKRSATFFGESWLNNAIVSGRSNNPIPFNENHQGFQFYDTWTKTILTNVDWRNYQPAASASSMESDNRVLIGMTHSDQFKPQGISAIRNFTFKGVARSRYVGHNVGDTGSSRYFNFVDWDGTAVNRTGPKIVGSHSNWWKLGNDCVWEADWQSWVCDRTASREVANIDVVVPGLIDSGVVFPSGSDVGNMSLFGNGITDRRSSVITRNVGITGATGVGWYMYLNNGAPKTFNIYTNLVIYGKSILFATPYPAGTTFTITTADRWWSGWKTNVTKVNTVDEVKNGNGNQYYFSGTHLYMKLVHQRLTGAPSEYFERGGVRIYSINQNLYYTIKATCTSATNFCPVADVLPPSTITIP